MKKSKLWGCTLLALTVLLLAVSGGLTVIIDPFFHYHAPLEGLAYPLSEQRYQNDGIVKHFDYDAVITGTSMTENFRVSELNELFGVNAVKVCFSGATFKEIDENVRRAIAANPEITMVVRSLDGYMLTEDKDAMRTDAEYPDYLYDDSIWNDVSYIFNKEILFKHTMKVLQYTLGGRETTSFDDYSFWADDMTFGAETALRNYSWDGEGQAAVLLTEESRQRMQENLRQNVIATAKENPDIEFYYFFPPYSVLWWQERYSAGTLSRQIALCTAATEELLQYDNIHLFSFTTEYDYVTDMDNYIDPEHYNADMNSRMLQDMRNGANQLTRENYQQHWAEAEKFYSTFYYAQHFEGYGFPLNKGQ